MYHPEFDCLCPSRYPDCCNPDAAFWRGEDSQTDPAGRDGYSGRSVSAYSQWCRQLCFLYVLYLLINNVKYSHSLFITISPSSLKENHIHMAHNERNMDWIGLQGPFCRYTIVQSYISTENIKKIFAKSWKLFVLSTGFMPRVIKVAPACAVMISSYEFGKSFFQKMNRERLASWRLSVCGAECCSVGEESSWQHTDADIYIRTVGKRPSQTESWETGFVCFFWRRRGFVFSWNFTVIRLETHLDPWAQYGVCTNRHGYWWRIWDHRLYVCWLFDFIGILKWEYFLDAQRKRLEPNSVDTDQTFVHILKNTVTMSLVTVIVPYLEVHRFSAHHRQSAMMKMLTRPMWVLFERLNLLKWHNSWSMQECGVRSNAWWENLKTLHQ